jgi:hypothetical protein
MPISMEVLRSLEGLEGTKTCSRHESRMARLAEPCPLKIKLVDFLGMGNFSSSSKKTPPKGRNRHMGSKEGTFLPL